MQIYIMRHGQAETVANSDKERKLTELGRSESQQMAVYLADNNVSFDAIFVSPYLRAQQTWESLQPFFPQTVAAQTLDFLTPNGSVRRSVDEILALQVAGVKSLLIVSHLPLVGYLVGELVPAAGVPAFITSSVAHIELDNSGFACLHSLLSVAELNNKKNA